MTSEQPSFSVTVHQNEYLPEGGREVDAILAVEATGGPAPTEVTAGRAEVIIIDSSGSMSGGKIEEAKRATAAAVDTLTDGTRFAVVAGTSEARMVYPRDRELATADGGTRKAAKRAVARLNAHNGTKISQWLLLTLELLAEHPDAIRHAILLTDGQDNDPVEQLQATLKQCAGHFTCHPRGIGTDWSPDQLHRIAEALMGTAEFVRDTSKLADDFRTMTETVMRKAVPDVALRLWTPREATVRSVKQVEPTIIDLTGKATASDPRTADYPTGSWGAERRDYHLRVELPPDEVGEERLAARVSLVPVPPGGVAAGDAEVLARANVVAEWTADEALSTRINEQVAHYTGQAELAAAIREGLAARQARDDDVATTKLGRAVQLAAELGEARKSEQLARIVDVLDEASGTVRLRGNVNRADEIELDIDSVKTTRTREEAPPGGDTTRTRDGEEGGTTRL